MSTSPTNPGPRPLTPAGLAEALEARPHQELPALPGRSNHLRCGVLVPIRWGPDPEVLVTRRPSALRHGGEWCFPGGRPEPGDADFYATACREGREELGLVNVVRLGRLSSMPIYTSDYRLEPFVVEVLDETLCPNPGEVEEVKALSIIEAVQAGTVTGIPFTWDGKTQHSPIYPIEDRYLFGATAHTFMELVAIAAVLMGTEPPRFVDAEVTWDEVFATAR